MMKLIVGSKGSGKTKAMIERINAVTKTTSGNVVVVETSMQLTYDIDHKARLIDLDGYKISGYDAMYGFLAGVLAGNYDITELFVDGILKICDHDLQGLAPFLEKLKTIVDDSTNVTITISHDKESLPQEVKAYL